MKHTARILASLALSAALLLGQAAIPAGLPVQAAAPALPLMEGNGEEGVPDTPTDIEEWGIEDPGLLYVGMAPKKMKTTGTPPTANIRWESNNKGVVDFDAEGQLIVKAVGTADISGTTGDLSVSKTKTVYVPFKVDLTPVQYDGKPHSAVTVITAAEMGDKWPENALPDAVISYNASNDAPTNADKYAVKVTMTKPVAVSNYPLGEFTITKKPLANFDIDGLAAGRAPDVSQYAEKTVTQTGKRIVFPELPADSAVSITGDCTFTYGDTSVAGKDKTGASVKITNLSVPNGLANYELKPSYEKSGLAYNVNAVDRVIKKLTVEKQPAKLKYNEKELLDLKGLSVKIDYNVGESESVPYEQFAAKGLTTAPEAGKELILEQNGKPVRVLGGTVYADTEKLAVTAAPVPMVTPTITVAASGAPASGGGDVSITVRLTDPTSSGAALPDVSKVTLANSAGLSPKTALNGSNGVYSAVYTLPNKTDSITFTASSAAVGNFNAATSAPCAVKTVFAAGTAAETNQAISALPTAAQISGYNAEQKAAVLQQAKALVSAIQKLSNGDKANVTAASLQKLDETFYALTGVSQPVPAVTSIYSSGSTNNLPSSGSRIVGAVAGSDVAAGDQLAFTVKQARPSGDRAIVQMDLSLKRIRGGVSTTAAFQIPVEVEIKLPQSFTNRNGLVLRHTGNGYSEELNFRIENNTLKFRTRGFSTFTLLKPQGGSNNNNNNWTGGGGGTVFDSYIITAKAGSGGTISPSGDVRVDREDDKTFTIRANSGYKVDKVLIDGEKKVTLKDGKYTFKEVTEPYTIEVTFVKVKPDVSSAPASSTPKTSSKIQVSQNAIPSTSSRKTSPSSKVVTSTIPSTPESSSSEEESSSEESSSEPVSSEESLPDSSMEESDPVTPAGNSGGGMSDSDLTVAVVIIVVVIALSLAAIFFGIYLSRKRDEEDDEDEE